MKKLKNRIFKSNSKKENYKWAKLIIRKNSPASFVRLESDRFLGADYISLSAETVLKFMVNYLLNALDDLQEFDDSNVAKNLTLNVQEKFIIKKEFVLGEKTAFVEILELIQKMDSNNTLNLNFDIQERYHLD